MENIFECKNQFKDRYGCWVIVGQKVSYSYLMSYYTEVERSNFRGNKSILHSSLNVNKNKQGSKSFDESERSSSDNDIYINSVQEAINIGVQLADSTNIEIHINPSFDGFGSGDGGGSGAAGEW